VPHGFSAPTRRGVLKGLTGIVLTAAACGIVDPSVALAKATGGAPRSLALKNLHTGEVLDTVYWAEGAYRPDACRALNAVLRDWRTGDEIAMDPKLFDLLHTLRRKMISDSPFDLISGYRSPATNAKLRKKSKGVAKKSYHMRGMAVDIHLPDRSLSRLRKTALELKLGGVGYYPKSGFVHVDTGKVRSWG
jgi:uncharacterized protein YcbK (DUF882 family)